jgi:hypothetical protein
MPCAKNIKRFMPRSLGLRRAIEVGVKKTDASSDGWDDQKDVQYVLIAYCTALSPASFMMREKRSLSARI